MIRLALAFIAIFAALPARAEIAIQELTTPDGINAWLVEDHSIPFVALELRFRGGAALDLPGKRGATNLMMALLEEGAGDRDARAFARATEELAASFRYDAGDDVLSVSAKMLTENRDEAAALLRASLTAPRFDQDALDRVRGQVISIIRSDQKDPRKISARAFDALAFGDHPYASSRNGSLDSVAALTREDIIAAHRNSLVKDRIYVSAVGDITADELTALLDSLLRDLPQSGVPLPENAHVNLPGGIKVIGFDTPQSVATFAQRGINRHDPDFFAAYVLNHILGGGGFESRLMTEVREKRGLTYGVYSYLLDMDNAQIWMGSVSSANDRIAEAIDVIRSEWSRIRDEGVTEDELNDAKTYLTGAYPLRFDGNGPIADIAAGMQVNGLPADYVTSRNDRVNAVTLDQINRVAKELLDPEHLTFVVTGKPEKLEATIN